MFLSFTQLSNSKKVIGLSTDQPSTHLKHYTLLFPNNIMTYGKKTVSENHISLEYVKTNNKVKMKLCVQ